MRLPSARRRANLCPTCHQQPKRRGEEVAAGQLSPQISNEPLPMTEAVMWLPMGSHRREAAMNRHQRQRLQGSRCWEFATVRQHEVP